jgi:peptidoglycan hydrolase-like protein with peptidoglycan-binding domain
MGKVIKLKESDLRNLVKQAINEAQSDPNIVAIQTALQNVGYGNLLGSTGIDGIYGNNTKNAIIAYQKANGIKPTGFVGKLTAPKLGVQPMKGRSGTTNTNGGVDPNLFKKVGMAGTTQKDATSVNKNLPTNAKLISKGDTTLSSNINPQWKTTIPVNKISSTDSTAIMKAGQPECAKFVHDFSPKLQYVGNAWDAHNNDSVGKRTWSAFTNLKPDTVKTIEAEWLKIHQAGGGKEGGQYNGEVKNLINTIVPKTPPVKLQLDNIVGIFYPPSGHHEEAFYNAGKAYFTDVNGKMTPGKTIQSGQGWGMNTHIGIVGAIKNGVPIVFHNVHGTVFADPFNKLSKGGRIAWIKVK